ncbi:MAG: tRNA (adenosine(37)-N6)-threonylcarbamoyltransferase complex ATPase subunit type 1 TsaE [Candidatus Magasanikbacteria bacterium CG_4_10_14_0_2_um_filter_37_12]|uniref:tRNA threonylcarbamoyladenosine biosynthesis protein TsaE n=1 Tax=Candidatus Magasanikbacteria bacterium CG_4_10_14_0_2_um_filter_37_12 TaxID=1974637 RepID=A0A2M7V6U0_9BACT|nr:MAG: tRNA (adenosine(37)-N6)-threonylcarbamoyltransferase complex ATPase subunit type 1 TsaE [Candidatus Magasanikbacteria bacterium CG_4_10_14_0_2_um_filter_37_12]
MKKIYTKKPSETQDLAKQLAQKSNGGDIILLEGDLGTGKTTFTKGFAMGLGIIEDEIVSPTFTLMQIYKIKNSKIKNLVHIDTYRLENEDQLIEIGVEDYLGDENSVCIIEWPEKISNLLKNKKTINLLIKHVDKNTREIEVT